MWRCTEFVDMIVTDPPYGIRAGARTSGRSKPMKQPRASSTSPNNNDNHNDNDNDNHNHNNNDDDHDDDDNNNDNNNNNRAHFSTIPSKLSESIHCPPSVCPCIEILHSCLMYYRSHRLGLKLRSWLTESMAHDPTRC